MMHQGVIILQAQIIGYDINGNMTGGSVKGDPDHPAEKCFVLERKSEFSNRFSSCV